LKQKPEALKKLKLLYADGLHTIQTVSNGFFLLPGSESLVLASAGVHCISTRPPLLDYFAMPQ
jgi:hypothetical protein